MTSSRCCPTPASRATGGVATRRGRGRERASPLRRPREQRSRRLFPARSRRLRPCSDLRVDATRLGGRGVSSVELACAFGSGEGRYCGLRGPSRSITHGRYSDGRWHTTCACCSRPNFDRECRASRRSETRRVGRSRGVRGEWRVEQRDRQVQGGEARVIRLPFEQRSVQMVAKPEVL